MRVIRLLLPDLRPSSSGMSGVREDARRAAAAAWLRSEEAGETYAVATSHPPGGRDHSTSHRPLVGRLHRGFVREYCVGPPS